MLRPMIAAAILFAVPHLSRAAEKLLPADRPVETVVDHYVDAMLKLDGIEPAPLADDATFVRRVTLDLVGRIPTTGESEEFVKSTDPQKRVKLVDRLMASPAFARFQAAQFDAMINGTVAGDDRKPTLYPYLHAALSEGKNWDAIFRDLMLPPQEALSGSGGKGKGKSRSTGSPADFLRSRVQDLDRLTNDVSVAFFGVNVSCAQCHDHPLVTDWKQDHFYGMKSFFARTFDASGFLAEREAGLVKFKPTKGPEKQAKLMFLTSTVVETKTIRELTKDEQKKDKEISEKAKSSKTPPPTPSFSAREKLVEIALKPGESDFFARSIVNRLWHRFLGEGLVMPLDQMHSENPPTHPQLLAWLARDMQSHGYDLRRLTRGIVLSKTYARSSRYPSESHPAPRYFAVAKLKPMTPQQLGTSLRIATQDPASFDKLKPEEFEKRIEQHESAGRGIASQIAFPTDDFQIGVGEALLFSNADRINRELLGDGNGGVLGRTKTVKEPREAIEMLVRTVYGRNPTTEETRALTEYLARRTDRVSEAYRQVLWALLTSAEFRFAY